MVQYIGAHILGNKNIPERIKECVTIGGNAIQIFFMFSPLVCVALYEPPLIPKDVTFFTKKILYYFIYVLVFKKCSQS